MMIRTPTQFATILDVSTRGILNNDKHRKTTRLIDCYSFHDALKDLSLTRNTPRVCKP
jgi:hypothetical protein